MSVRLYLRHLHGYVIPKLIADTDDAYKRAGRGYRWCS